MLARENFLKPRSEPDPDPVSRSLDESKLFTDDGGVKGGEIARACWFCGGGRGSADIASGRASSARRRKTNNFMMSDKCNGWRSNDHISLRWSIGGREQKI